MKIKLVLKCLFISVIFFTCSSDINPIQNNHLRIYNNDILENEYVYTDNFQLLKEIKYDTSGAIIESTAYSYIDGLISEALVSNSKTEIALVKYDFSKQDTVELIVESQNGYNGTLVDYPFAPNGSTKPELDNVTQFNYYYSESGNKVNIRGKSSYTPIGLYYNFTQTNIKTYNVEFNVQIDVYTDYEHDTNENIFYKFGFIKFDPIWLSFNNVIAKEVCVYDWYSYNEHCGQEQRIEYEFNSEGLPISVNDLVYVYTKE